MPVLLGDGDGSFRPPVIYSGAGYLSDLVLGDFNGDGKTDIATVQAIGGRALILMLPGNGDGILGSMIVSPGPSLFNHVTITSADFNKNGKLDLFLLYGDGFQGLGQVFLCRRSLRRRPSR